MVRRRTVGWMSYCVFHRAPIEWSRRRGVHMFRFRMESDGGSFAHYAGQISFTICKQSIRRTRMKRLRGAIRDLWRDEDGAALVEYAVLVALIAVIAIIFITSLGKKISNKFSEIDARL